MKNAEPTQPKKKITMSPIVGEMKVGQAEVRYSHCAERQRRHFQIAVYKTYERAMALGTLIEENIIIKPRISTKKCTKTISQPSKKSARWGGLEGEWFSMKNSEPTRPEGTPQIFDPTIKSELLAREGGGGGDLIVGEAPPNNKKSQPLTQP